MYLFQRLKIGSYQREEIDYDKLHSKYWPHANAGLIKKFDFSKVFIKIMSIFKRRVQGVKFGRGVLSKESYCLLASSPKELNGSQKINIYTPM